MSSAAAATTGRKLPPPLGAVFSFFILPFLFVSPSFTFSHPFPVFFFSPLPNWTPRSQGPCLPDPALPLPLRPDQDVRDSPPPAPGSCLRRGERFRFLITASPSEGQSLEPWACLDFQPGCPQTACLQAAASVKIALWDVTPGGQGPGAALHTLLLGSVWPGAGRSSSSCHGGRKAIMSRDRQGPWESTGGLELPQVHGASSAPWGTRRGPGGRCCLLAPPSPPHKALS